MRRSAARIVNAYDPKQLKFYPINGDYRESNPLSHNETQSQCINGKASAGLEHASGLRPAHVILHCAPT